MPWAGAGPDREIFPKKNPWRFWGAARAHLVLKRASSACSSLSLSQDPRPDGSWWGPGAAVVRRPRILASAIPCRSWLHPCCVKCYDSKGIPGRCLTEIRDHTVPGCRSCVLSPSLKEQLPLLGFGISSCRSGISLLLWVTESPTAGEQLRV